MTIILIIDGNNLQIQIINKIQLLIIHLIINILSYLWKKRKILKNWKLIRKINKKIIIIISQRIMKMIIDKILIKTKKNKINRNIMIQIQIRKIFYLVFLRFKTRIINNCQIFFLLMKIKYSWNNKDNLIKIILIKCLKYLKKINKIISKYLNRIN